MGKRPEPSYTRWMAGLSRKTVTVLFADIVNWTPLGEALDPESIRAFQTRLFDEVRTVIERHGGTVEKYMGDAVMAVFGVPHVHEDDALRAVRAADEMRAALARVNATAARPISLRTGLNTGEVVAGGGHGLITGDAVNVAARLETAAGPGEILIGAQTYELVRDAVLAEPVEPLEVKGKSTRVVAWRVTAVIPGAPGRARRFDSNLVGRDAELALLRQALDRVARQRSPHLFTILGAAGVGKSRLARELIARARANAQILVGRCLPYGEGITFWPLRDMVRALDVGSLVGPAHAAVIQHAASGGAVMPDAMLRALRFLVEALGRERTVVIVLEDVHWAEPTLLDVVERLTATMRDTPVLVLCLARPEFFDDRGAWGRGALNATTILLEPLDSNESEQLVANLSGPSIPRPLIATITDVAEGNPLFLEEMVAMVVEDPTTVSVPPTIHALLTARLERLPQPERDVLAAASVLGRFFSQGGVEELLSTAVGEQLESLVRKELVRPRPAASGDAREFRFRHILIRDAAYGALPKERRAEWHARVAEWLDTSGDGEIEELVGYHLEQAAICLDDLGRPDRTLSVRAGARLGATGRRAVEHHDMPAGAALLRRALALLDAEEDEVPSLLHALSTALWGVAETAEADEMLELAIAGAISSRDRRLEWTARLDQVARRSVSGGGGDGDVERVATEARDVFEKLGDHAGLARCWRRFALVSSRRCRLEQAEREASAALTHAQAAGDLQERARAIDLLCTALLVGPRPAEQGITACRRLLAATDGNILVEANVASSLVGLEAMAGRFDDARALAARAGAIYEELGLRQLQAGLAQIVASMELLAGDASAALAELDTAAALDRGPAYAHTAAIRAEALLVSGRVEEADAAATEALALAADHDVEARLRAGSVCTRVDVAARRTTEALATSAAVLALAEETDALILRGDAHRARACALTAAGDGRGAAEHVALAAQLYRRKGRAVSVETAVLVTGPRGR
jgi:class 3 adenylate cyclase/predicted ATPase